jgi:hypothetical protein
MSPLARSILDLVEVEPRTWTVPALADRLAVGPAAGRTPLQRVRNAVRNLRHRGYEVSLLDPREARREARGEKKRPTPVLAAHLHRGRLARIAEAARMYRAGATTEDVATALGVRWETARGYRPADVPAPSTLQQEAVRVVRQSPGLTVSEVAAHVGCTPRTVLYAVTRAGLRHRLNRTNAR